MTPHLTVIIPFLNEAASLAEVIRRVVATGLATEIIAVDDGSSDESVQILQELQRTTAPQLKVLRHERNRGKGAAIRTGLAAATGKVILVQDADLEYNPAEYAALMAPFVDPAVQVVFGSRIRGNNPKSSQAFYWGGRYLSWLTNLLYRSQLTDLTTGYKAVRTDLLRALDLRCDGFEFCPELTVRLLRRGVHIEEVPISYRPRSRAEGKKIRARHGLAFTWLLLRMRLSKAKAEGLKG